MTHYNAHCVSVTAQRKGYTVWHTTTTNATMKDKEVLEAGGARWEFFMFYFQLIFEYCRDEGADLEELKGKNWGAICEIPNGSIKSYILKKNYILKLSRGQRKMMLTYFVKDYSAQWRVDSRTR